MTLICLFLWSYLQSIFNGEKEHLFDEIASLPEIKV